MWLQWMALEIITNFLSKGGAYTMYRSVLLLQIKTAPFEFYPN